MEYVALKGVVCRVPRKSGENASLPLFSNGEAVEFSEYSGTNRRRKAGAGTAAADLKIAGCGFGVGLSRGSACFEADGVACPELIEL